MNGLQISLLKSDQFKDSEKIQELKQREDHYYQQIQDTLKELENVERMKAETSIEQARENYQKKEFLEGIDGFAPQKQVLESKILQYQTDNKMIEKEMELKSKLQANEIAQLKLDLIEYDI